MKRNFENGTRVAWKMFDGNKVFGIITDNYYHEYSVKRVDGTPCKVARDKCWEASKTLNCTK